MVFNNTVTGYFKLSDNNRLFGRGSSSAWLPPTHSTYKSLQSNFLEPHTNVIKLPTANKLHVRITASSLRPKPATHLCFIVTGYFKLSVIGFCIFRIMLSLGNQWTCEGLITTRSFKASTSTRTRLSEQEVGHERDLVSNVDSRKPLNETNTKERKNPAKDHANHVLSVCRAGGCGGMCSKGLNETP
jgi:hypothetical protein